MTMTVAPDGTMRCLYTEEIDLSAIGNMAIQRTSNVNPDDMGQWWAEILPDGPLLGPFAKRSEALAAEIDYIENNVL
jgi:hypothetical protein